MDRNNPENAGHKLQKFPTIWDVFYIVNIASHLTDTSIVWYLLYINTISGAFCSQHLTAMSVCESISVLCLGVCHPTWSGMVFHCNRFRGHSRIHLAIYIGTGCAYLITNVCADRGWEQLYQQWLFDEMASHLVWPTFIMTIKFYPLHHMVSCGIDRSSWYMSGSKCLETCAWLSFQWATPSPIFNLKMFLHAVLNKETLVTWFGTEKKISTRVQAASVRKFWYIVLKHQMCSWKSADYVDTERNNSRCLAYVMIAQME